MIFLTLQVKYFLNQCQKAAVEVIHRDFKQKTIFGFVTS